MRYSNYIGVFAAVMLVISCFMTWVHLGSLNANITGFNTYPATLGKPGVVHVFFAVLAAPCFLLPFIWAKRINPFITSFNLSWCIRNFLVITQCQMGECPEIKAGMYAIIGCSILMLVMSFIPKMPMQQRTLPG